MPLHDLNTPLDETSELPTSQLPPVDTSQLPPVVVSQLPPVEASQDSFDGCIPDCPLETVIQSSLPSPFEDDGTMHLLRFSCEHPQVSDPTYLFYLIICS